MTSIRYTLLFTIELLHRFFADLQFPDGSIVPSVQTAELLKNNRVVVKQVEHRLYAGIETDNNVPANPPSKPFLIPPEGTQLTFFLEINNPLFFNYTQLPFAAPSGKLYYFSNRANNVSNGKHYLSQPIIFNNGKTYTAGELAVNAGGMVFRAKRTLSGIAPPATAVDSADWQTVDANRYFTEEDSVQWRPALSTFVLDAAQTAAAIRVFGYDAATNDYTTLVHAENKSFPDAVVSFPLNLSGLPAGKYRLEVNGNAHNIYLNEELNRRKVFAVIDLFHEHTLPVGYALLNNNDELLSPLFTIAFINRATIWKYVLAGTEVGSISDNDGVYDFAGPPATIIQSVSPIPLFQKALHFTLSVGGQEVTPIACAGPQRLSQLVTPSDTFYCSEIFLTY